MAVLCLLPLHTQIIYRILPLYGAPTSLCSIWKDLLIVLIFYFLILNLFIKKKEFQITTLNFVALLFLCLLIVLVLVSDDFLQSLYGFRTFVEPFLAFIIASYIIVDKKSFNRFVCIFYSIGVFCSVWGIYQAAVLGGEFLIRLGYPSQYGRLHNSFYISFFLFQRAVSTFSSPNTYGIYMQIIIMAGLYLYHNKTIQNKYIYYASQFICISGLLYSFSRSSWLALLLSFIVFYFFIYKINKTIKKGVISSIIMFIFFIILSFFNFDFVKPLSSHVANSVTLEDPSAVGHVDSIVQSVNSLLKNPLGHGLGQSGPRASVRTGKFLNAENSFLIVGLDSGVIGLLLYLLMFGCLLGTMYKKACFYPSDLFQKTFFAILVGQFFAWNLLPYVCELEVVIVFFSLLGFCFNSSIFEQCNESFAVE